MVEVENAGGGVKGQVAPDSRGRCSWQRPLSAPAAPDTTYYSCQLRLLLLLLRFLLAAPASHSRSGCSDERALGKQVRGRSLLPQIPCCSGTRESCVHDRGLVPALSLSTGIGLFARSPKQEVNPRPASLLASVGSRSVAWPNRCIRTRPRRHSADSTCVVTSPGLRLPTYPGRRPPTTRRIWRRHGTSWRRGPVVASLGTPTFGGPLPTSLCFCYTPAHKVSLPPAL